MRNFRFSGCFPSAALNSEPPQEKKPLELASIELAKIGLSEFARRLQIDKANMKNSTIGMGHWHFR